MKKKFTKRLRQIAEQLPDATRNSTRREYRVLPKDWKPSKDDLTLLQIDKERFEASVSLDVAKSSPKEFDINTKSLWNVPCTYPINHYSRLKKCFKRGGLEAVQAYCKHFGVSLNMTEKAA